VSCTELRFGEATSYPVCCSVSCRVCCSVLQCIAFSLLRCVDVCCSVLHICAAATSHPDGKVNRLRLQNELQFGLQWVAVRTTACVAECVASCQKCIVLMIVATHCNLL